MTRATRPYVICHMMPSIDGRIVTERWKLAPGVMAEYDQTAETFRADGWMIGRVSMEPYAGKGRVTGRKAARPIPRTDFIAPHDAESYAIALDPSGKLGWRSGSIDEEHVITVLTRKVPDAYLSFLRSRGVSYLFGGATELDLSAVLRKLRSKFGIRTLLLEGGGSINGSFLAADLIDELSVLVVPIGDGSVGTPSLFDATEGRGPTRHLRLLSAGKRRGGLVWLRYRFRRRR